MDVEFEDIVRWNITIDETNIRTVMGGLRKLKPTKSRKDMDTLSQILGKHQALEEEEECKFHMLVLSKLYRCKGRKCARIIMDFLAKVQWQTDSFNPNVYVVGTCDEALEKAVKIATKLKAPGLSEYLRKWLHANQYEYYRSESDVGGWAAWKLVKLEGRKALKSLLPYVIRTSNRGFDTGAEINYSVVEAIASLGQRAINEMTKKLPKQQRSEVLRYIRRMRKS